jgi:MRG-binding protein
MELLESPDPSLPFLDTVEGEIAFFRSIMRARPVGLHRHFHVLSIRTVIHQDTGRYVSIDDVWEKLRTCYNIEALENLVRFPNSTPTEEPFSPLNKLNS